MKRVKLKSGANGYQCKLRENYANYEEFAGYAEVYGLHKRLGYKTAAGAWRANPEIEGGVNPADYRRAK